MNTNRFSRFAVAAFACAGAVAAVSPLAQAQPPAPAAGHMAPPAGGRPGMRQMDPATLAKMKAMREKIIAELKLTPDQQAKIQKEQADYQKQLMALSTDKSLTLDQKKTKFAAMRAANQTKMNAILTPAQQAKMKEMRKAMMQQMKTQAPPSAAKPKR